MIRLTSSMNKLFSKPISSVSRKLLLKTIVEAQLENEYHTLQKDLGCRIETEPIPEVISVSKDIRFAVSIICYEQRELLCVLEVLMPCRKVEKFKCSRSKGGQCDCSLIWMLCPKAVQIPRIEGKTGGYHDIKLFNNMLTQPRETTVWGKSYTFSNATHEVEPGEVPSDIQQLFVATEKLMNLPKGSVNMCLKNLYSHKRHCIGEHSDDDKEMGNLRDVFCWCDGSGELVVRARKNCSELNGGDVSKQTPKEREVIRIIIPSGLYVMQGQCFQKEYTHEFPEQYSAFYKRLHSQILNDTTKFPDFPRETILSDCGANRTHLIQADWIAAHHERVSTVIVAPKDKNMFELWRQPRVSYTLRGFKDDKGGKESIQKKIKI